jgi:hypothetical protein
MYITLLPLVGIHCKMYVTLVPMPAGAGRPADPGRSGSKAEQLGPSLKII